MEETKQKLMNKDKLFLIAYFGVKDQKDKLNSLMMIQQFDRYLTTKLDDNSVKFFILPNPESNIVTIELLNVKDCDDQKLEELKNIYIKFLEEKGN